MSDQPQPPKNTEQMEGRRIRLLEFPPPIELPFRTLPVSQGKPGLGDLLDKMTQLVSRPDLARLIAGHLQTQAPPVDGVFLFRLGFAWDVPSAFIPALEAVSPVKFWHEQMPPDPKEIEMLTTGTADFKAVVKLVFPTAEERDAFFRSKECHRVYTAYASPSGVIAEYAQAHKDADQNHKIMAGNPTKEQQDGCIIRMGRLAVATQNLDLLAGREDNPPALQEYQAAAQDRGCDQCWLSSKVSGQHPECQDKIDRMFAATAALVQYGLSLQSF